MVVSKKRINSFKLKLKTMSKSKLGSKSRKHLNKSRKNGMKKKKLIKMIGGAFPIQNVNELGDIYLVGRLPLSSVTLSELDRIFGAVLEYCDTTFNTLLEMGFADAIRREWAWRLSRGESMENLKAFAHLVEAER